MTDRLLLRLATALLLGGLLLTFVVGAFHPDKGDANDHASAFTHYANSDAWTAVHLGQFVSMAIAIGGLIALFFALGIRSGPSLWLNRLGVVAAGVALAAYAVLQAVDGVALKQSVDAWLAASPADAPIRFASAEAIRWLEWGMRSYFSFLLGLAFVMFGLGLVRSARVPRPIGLLMALTGLAYIAQGWVVGSEGFSASNSLPTLVGYGVWLVWGIWFLFLAWQPARAVHWAET